MQRTGERTRESGGGLTLAASVLDRAGRAEQCCDSSIQMLARSSGKRAPLGANSGPTAFGGAQPPKVLLEGALRL